MQFGLPAINGLAIGITAILVGLIILILPHILNYFVGGLLIVSGGIGIAGGSVFPGVISIIIGIIILIFPHVVNYLVGIYLILLGVWFIFAASSLIIGIVTIGVGIFVMFFPDILNFIFGIYLIAAGIIAIGHYLKWF
jgi:uncharacterized membrane protein HdeD (DUF308 family)